jgi:hypothetical protein
MIEIQRTITLHDDLYRYQTWFLTRRDEHRLRVFEIRELRMISGPTKKR